MEGKEGRGLLVGIKTGLNEFQKAGFSNSWTTNNLQKKTTSKNQLEAICREVR